MLNANDNVSNITNEETVNIEIEIESDETNSNDDDSNDALIGTMDEKESRFRDGDQLTMIRVRFPGNSRSFPFLIGKRKFSYGQKVLAMSDRGMTVGYINSFPYIVTFNKSMLPIRSIAKLASEEDIKAQIDFRASEKKAEVICLHLIERYKLDMVLTHVEFIQFGKKAVFYFNAPERVDFRELVKDLVADLKMRIELRQISVRDRAAALGAIGACGLQTCCSSFLKNYGNVSIKMAKNQNLALIPSKLNGVCGQIKCCIKYEDDVYLDKRKNLPEENSIIRVKNGDIGKVLRLHLLVEQFELLTDRGAKRRYAANQYDKVKSNEPDLKFPETFEHIVDETKEVIGLIKEIQVRSDLFLNEQGQDLEEELEVSESLDDEYEDDEENESINDDFEKVELDSTKSVVQNNRPVQHQHNKQVQQNQNHKQNVRQETQQQRGPKTDNRSDNRNNVNRHNNHNRPKNNQQPNSNNKK
jgi:cell fate regulator YaaT (PSP1 superfamily)